MIQAYLIGCKNYSLSSRWPCEFWYRDDMFYKSQMFEMIIPRFTRNSFARWILCRALTFHSFCASYGLECGKRFVTFVQTTLTWSHIGFNLECVSLSEPRFSFCNVQLSKPVFYIFFRTEICIVIVENAFRPFRCNSDTLFLLKMLIHFRIANWFYGRSHKLDFE